MKLFSDYIIVALILLLSGISALPVSAQVILNDPPELSRIDIEEHLGDYIPLDLTFTDAAGTEVRLEKYFNKGKPVFLVLAYYECPMLCTLVLNSAANGILGVTNLDPGTDYEVLTVSIDPDETAELAAQKQNRYVKIFGARGTEGSWKFHVGDEQNIKSLSDALGFKYYYVEERDEYAHPAAAFILTEEGKISRYLYGIDFKPRDLRLGLLEAADGKIGTTIDRIILYCFHYDPDARGYVLFAQNVMKVGGAITVIILALFLGSLWAKERMKKTPVDKLTVIPIKAKEHAD